ncbi:MULTISPECIES: hypothetical protein [Gammaproteobacteria]|jgi:hypothetical protein|nr:hypothetical protein [Pseudomonas sp. Hp2]
MNRTLLLLGALLACASAMAQEPAGAGTSASDLDLSVPQAPIQYRSDPTYAKDPPGTFYGDKSGKSASATVREQQRIAARAEQCQGQLHGSVAAGVGYSSRGGNSNWQGANLHSCKTYYDDDGNPREVGISISVGRSEGPGYFGHPYGYGHGPIW